MTDVQNANATEEEVYKHCDAYFKEVTPPPLFNETMIQVQRFIGKLNTNQRIVLVTSGATMVPVEFNTVSYIDNFSTGARGSASAEYFLEKGYKVIFLHRLIIIANSGKTFRLLRC